MAAFLEKWLAAVERNNSVLCAGLDPAEFEMGREVQGLPENVDKRIWSLRYVEAVAPYAAAIKPNAQYWKDGEEGNDMKTLQEVVELAHSLGLVVIEDAKLSDIGSTNDAGLCYSEKKGFDAVTIAPYAGNLEEASRQANERNIGIFTMCLMSNPEYEVEKRMLVEIGQEELNEYRAEDIFHLLENSNWTGVNDIEPRGDYVSRYIKLAHDAAKFGLDGIVIGAPSAKNHIKEDEIADVHHYVGDDMLVLLPGVGAQGGEANAIWKYFAADRVIVNVGRALMFPDDNNHPTADEHTAKAKFYMEMLNELRRV